MKILVIAATAILALAGCSTDQTTAHGTKRCGLVGCVSSPFLAAKLSPTIIGQPPSAAISRAGAPTDSYSSGGVDYLTWRREQNDPSLGLLACTETVTVTNGTITDYRFDGHC